MRISAVALIKMTMHAVAGGKNEIMGLMNGTVDGDTMIVVDAYVLAPCCNCGWRVPQHHCFRHSVAV